MYAAVIPEPMPARSAIGTVAPVGTTSVSERVSALLRRFRSVDPRILDALIGTACVVLALGGHFASGADSNAGLRDPNVLSVVLTLMVAVPFYFRRRNPLAVLLISEIGVIGLTLPDYRTGAAPTLLLVAVYTVAAWSPPRDRVVGAGAMAIGLIIVAIGGIPGANGADMVFNAVLFSAAYLFGSTMRNRRLYSEELEARAAALERDRDQEAKRAVAEERLRIAQELHDVVAHSMGVIAVQAGVGAHVIDSDPEEARKSLEAISHTSRSTLTEIRRMLGVLRDDTGAQYAPAPGLEELDRLVRDVEQAGVPVEVRKEGAQTDVPPGVDFTAYRIVQEALTNVLKHAGRARVDLLVGYEDAALRLEIADDGRGVNGRANRVGHGLMGMRERVAVYGGSFEAGPRTGGGFRVAVRLPYGEPA
jgi:signal transduction histidine kinase